MRFAPALLVAGLMVSSAAGCGYLDLLPGRTIHQKCGWKAEDYFRKKRKKKRKKETEKDRHNP
jgi:hypothetical protein